MLKYCFMVARLFFRNLTIGLVASAAMLTPVAAVVISSGDGSGNTTAPLPAADDPGFDNVGVFGGASAVYLGNRWIITAAHVTVGTSVNFGGTSYTVDAGTNTRLTQPSDPAVVDLRMIRLDADPGLPALTIASAAPTVGEDVVMVGRGRNRLASTSYWAVDTVPNPDVWTSVIPPTPHDEEGFGTSGTRTVRWGENEVHDESTIFSWAWGDTQSFSTRFDAAGMTHEAQGIAGDSGGGVFARDGVDWELIGIMYAIGTASGQPGSTAVYGNETYVADLSFYADQINSLVAVPEPVVGVLALASLFLFVRRTRR